MLLKGANKIKSVRFRRWTRKTYAVFASLGKIISIGNLKIEMAGQTLFCGFERFNRNFTEQPDDEADSEYNPESFSTDILLTAEIISIPVSQYTEAADLIPVFCINQRLEQFRLV